MKKAKTVLYRLLFPPVWLLCTLPPIIFGALIAVFVMKKNNTAAAYVIYVLSAYALTVWCAVVPKGIAALKRFAEKVKNSKPAKKIVSTEFGDKYLHDKAFRGNVGIYQGMLANFLYMLFRAITGIYYRSVWFLSIAVYYLVLGLLRSYLTRAYRRKKADDGIGYEYRCYRKTAILLFLLNIPMGGTILLTIITDSSYSYPGYIIYLSAAYTFYIAIIAVVNLVKFRKIGSPILSAAKVLNLVAAMMSILGLQTAMISQFSVNGDGFRKLMNTLTGSGVYASVIAIAVYMLVYSHKKRRENATNE